MTIVCYTPDGGKTWENRDISLQIKFLSPPTKAYHDIPEDRDNLPLTKAQFWCLSRLHACQQLGWMPKVDVGLIKTSEKTLKILDSRRLIFRWKNNPSLVCITGMGTVRYELEYYRTQPRTF